MKTNDLIYLILGILLAFIFFTLVFINASIKDERIYQEHCKIDDKILDSGCWVEKVTAATQIFDVLIVVIFLLMCYCGFKFGYLFTK